MNPDGPNGGLASPTNDGRVTLAVLRNDVMHLVASVELLRVDLQALSADFREWQKTSEDKAQEKTLRIDRLENQMRLARWLLLAVWGILTVIITGWIKSVLGL